MFPVFINILVAATACFSEVTVKEYKAVVVREDYWVNSISSTAPARSAVHCGILCKKKGDCYGLRYEDGVCNLSDSWIQTTTAAVKDTTTFYRPDSGLLLSSTPTHLQPN